MYFRFVDEVDVYLQLATQVHVSLQ